MQKFIFFDIDDTLYRRSLPFQEAFLEYFGADGKKGRTNSDDVDSAYADTVHADTEELFRLTQIRCEEVYFPVLRGEMTAEEGLIYRFQKGFEDAGMAISRQEALSFAECYRKAQANITLDPEAQKVLDLCSGKFAGIGLITNGRGPLQRAKIEKLGLGRWISEKLTVISGEVGADKPDLKIFEIAAELAGEASENLVYVGDSMENDIIPAKKAGWKAVYWDRENIGHTTGEIFEGWN